MKDEDTSTAVLNPGRPLQIGEALARVDAPAKVTGRERYAVDFYAEGMLWAGVKRAGIPHAVFKGVDVKEAEKVDGVLAVLTAKDIEGSNRQGVARRDQPVLVDDRIRHRGDGVALVIAESREALEEAIQKIKVEATPLPGVFDMEEALKETAPRIHEDHPGGNALLSGHITTGKGVEAFADCAYVVEATIELPYQEHAYLETEAGWAVAGADGTVSITVSTQTPFRDKREVAEALGLPMDRVRIVAPYCGGAFGGKDGITVQSLLALAALRFPGRPVKMWWQREESFIASAKRHRALCRYRLGAGVDGRFHALEAEIFYDTGPYDHLGGAVMALGLEHAGGPYRIPHADLKAWAVYTNNPVGGAFRAFGVAQATAAMEQMIDRLAAKIGMSPLDIRRANAVNRGDTTPLGVTLTTSTGIGRCLEILRDHRMWRDRDAWKAGAGPARKRGIGIAAVMHGMGYGPVIPDTANAKIVLTREGRFRVACGVVDMGQGNAHTFLQMAGEILSQDLSRLEVVLPDTAWTLPSGSASASRTTYTYGNALISAANQLRDRILRRCADLMMMKADELALVPGRVRHLPTGREMALAEIAATMDEAERTAVAHYRAPQSPQLANLDPNLRLHGIPHVVFSYGVHLAGIEVDLLTGAVTVLRYLAVNDCGRILNRQLFEQQVQGGIAQGLGYALMEEIPVTEGEMKTVDFSTYLLPTALDVPDMEVIDAGGNEPTGPYGMKGIGEMPTSGPLPAVANALADACGIRLKRFPMTPERVLAALEEGKA
jgi:CO/xanthine dehydrogenase Mo-binding subunit